MALAQMGLNPGPMYDSVLLPFSGQELGSGFERQLLGSLGLCSSHPSLPPRKLWRVHLCGVHGVEGRIGRAATFHRQAPHPWGKISGLHGVICLGALSVGP